MTSEIKETFNKNIRTLKVEHEFEDYLTVTKRKNNKDYQVELLIFSEKDLEDFKKIQDEYYEELNEEKSVKDKMSNIFTRLLKS